MTDRAPSTTDLAAVTSAEELAAAMRTLYELGDQAPLRELESWGLNQSQPLPKSTLHDALSAKRLPSQRLLRHFLAAHRVRDESLVRAWLDALKRVQSSVRPGVAAERRPEPALAERFFVEADNVTEISRLIDRVVEQVWLLGTTLSMHVPYLRPALQRAITNGRDVRILLIKPGGAAMAMSAFRAGPDGMSAEEQEEQLRNNLTTLANLARFGPKLEIRLIDYLAPYTLYAYDPGLDTGRMVLRLGSFHGRHELRPTFQVERARDYAWFDYFYGQFVSLWNAAETHGPGAG